MVFQSDITQTSKRGSIILGSLSIFWYILVLTYASVGAGTGNFYSQNVKPLEDQFSNIAAGFVESLKSDDYDSPEFPKSGVRIQINNKVDTSTDSGKTQETQQTEYYYVQPTVVYTYPTVEQGKPGSQEWSDQFWQDYNSTKQNIENSKIDSEQFWKDYEQRSSDMQKEYEQNVNEAREEQNKRIEQNNQELCAQNSFFCN